MFKNRYTFFEELYLEELEVLEKEMEDHPLEMNYVYEWQMIAELIKEVRIAKDFNY